MYILAEPYQPNQLLKVLEIVPYALKIYLCFTVAWVMLTIMVFIDESSYLFKIIPRCCYLELSKLARPYYIFLQVHHVYRFLFDRLD